MIDRQAYIRAKFLQLGQLSSKFCVAKSAGKTDQAFDLWKRFEDCSQECKELNPALYAEYLKGYPSAQQAAEELADSTIAKAKKVRGKLQSIATQGNLLTN